MVTVMSSDTMGSCIPTRWGFGNSCIIKMFRIFWFLPIASPMAEGISCRVAAQGTIACSRLGSASTCVIAAICRTLTYSSNFPIQLITLGVCPFQGGSPTGLKTTPLAGEVDLSLGLMRVFRRFVIWLVLVVLLLRALLLSTRTRNHLGAAGRPVTSRIARRLIRQQHTRLYLRCARP